MIKLVGIYSFMRIVYRKLYAMFEHLWIWVGNYLGICNDTLSFSFHGRWCCHPFYAKTPFRLLRQIIIDCGVYLCSTISHASANS